MSEKHMKTAVSESISEIYIAVLRWEAPIRYLELMNWVAVYSNIPNDTNNKPPFAVLAPIGHSNE